MIPTTASPKMTPRIVGSSAAAGNNGIASRINPNVPIFSIKPARITEPAVGASTCASGNHVWNGNIGTFTANAMKNAANNHRAATGDKACGEAAVTIAEMLSNEKSGAPGVRSTSVTVAWFQAWNPRYKIATSMSSDPRNV